MAASKESIEQSSQQIKLIEKPSANHSNEKLTPQFIILHCIGFDEDYALKILTKPLSEGGGGVSSHFLIPQVKENSLKENAYPIFNIVPHNIKARHAGASSWGKVGAFNNCSIGIEFHSPNYAKALQFQAGKGALDWFHFEEFTETQIDAGIQLIHDLMKKYNIKRENILGHSDIAPYREDPAGNIILGKTDPGLTFPWERLAKAGIGVWPKNNRTRSGTLDTSLKQVQTLLATYGYSVPVTGILDIKTQHVIKAFQMHYMPKQQYDGKITAEMIICLENLIDRQFAYGIEPSNKLPQSVHSATNYPSQSAAAGSAIATFSDAAISAKTLAKSNNPALQVIEGVRNKMTLRSDFAALDEYLWELTALVTHQNPKPSSSIDYVWVLSARATYLKNKVAKDPLLKDINDDYNRMELGVKIAKEITSTRTKKTIAALCHQDYLQQGPTIIYNGRPEQNRDLQTAAKATGTIAGYPMEKFTILALAADKLHTGGQFLSVKGAKLPLDKGRHFALVTHTYHWMRVSRMFDHSPIQCFDDANGFAFLVDRQLTAPGANLDVEGEVFERLPKYISQKEIAKDPTKRITDKRQYASDDIDTLIAKKSSSKTKLIQFNIYQQTKFPETILKEINQFLGPQNSNEADASKARIKRSQSL